MYVVPGLPFSALHGSSGLEPLLTGSPHQSLRWLPSFAGPCNLLGAYSEKESKFFSPSRITPVAHLIQEHGPSFLSNNADFLRDDLSYRKIGKC